VSHLLTDALTRRALLELLLVGGLCGVVGVHVVLRRLAFLTESLSHACFPGIVVADLVRVSPWWGAGASSLAMAGWMAQGSRHDGDTSSATAIGLTGAFGAGALLISTQSGFSKDLTAVMVGSPLTVSGVDLTVTAGAAALVLTVLAAVHKELVLAAFDRTTVESQGYPVRRLDALLCVLLALTLVACMPAVGALLSIALLVGPPLAALRWTRRVLPAMVLGAVLGATCGVAGLALSFAGGLATGACTALLAAAVVVVALATRR